MVHGLPPQSWYSVSHGLLCSKPRSKFNKEENTKWRTKSKLNLGQLIQSWMCYPLRHCSSHRISFHRKLQRGVISQDDFWANNWVHKKFTAVNSMVCLIAGLERDFRSAYTQTDSGTTQTYLGIFFICPHMVSLPLLAAWQRSHRDRICTL